MRYVISVLDRNLQTEVQEGFYIRRRYIRPNSVS